MRLVSVVGHMRRIFIISTGLNTGGAEMMLLKILSELSEAERHSYLIVSLLDKGTIGGRIESLGVEVVCLRMNTLRGLLMSIFLFSSLAWRHLPTAYVGWMYHGNLFSVLGWIISGFRARMIWNVRHSLYDIAHETRVTRVIIRFQSMLSRLPQAIVFNSRAAMEQHAAIGYVERNFVFIPNGFDCKKYKPDPVARMQVREELGLHKTAPVIGMVARNHPMKNPACFVAAMSEVAKVMPDALFVLAGRGMDDDVALSNQVVAAGLSGRFFLIPEHPATHRLFNAFDVACLTSSWGEGFPNVIGEALACGVLVVATDVGQSREVVDEFGHIAPVDDPAVIASGVLKLLSLSAAESDDIRLRAAASIAERYGIGEVARGFHATFLGVERGTL